MVKQVGENPFARIENYFMKGLCTSSLAWLSSVIHDKPSSFFQDHLNNVYTLRLSSILRDLYNAPTR